MPDPITLSSLRTLVAARFPTATRKHGARVPTGAAALDAALGGGVRFRVRLAVRADRVAVVSTPDPAVHASALEKIYRANNTPPVLTRANRSYFNLYDRMIAAGVEPGFPRPLKPKRFHWTSAALLIVVIAGFVGVISYG